MTHRSLIAIIVAGAMAVTGMSGTPARAGNDDIGKWIAGAVALGIIGAVIAEDRKRDRRRDQIVTRNNAKTHVHRHNSHGKHHAKTDRRRVLPASCAFRLRTQRGEYHGFGQRCLLRNYAHFNALPHQCAHRPKGGQGRVVYGRDCLRNHGYRVAAY